jgi:hypothetical protein
MELRRDEQNPDREMMENVPKEPTFPSPSWTKRPPTPGALCWSRHFIQAGDSDAVEYVSTSGSVVRFCGACSKHWREEAHFLSNGGYRH